jgi:hypothetical protein
MSNVCKECGSVQYSIVVTQLYAHSSSDARGKAANRLHVKVSMWRRYPESAADRSR